MSDRPFQPALWSFALACGVVLCLASHVVAEDKPLPAAEEIAKDDPFLPLMLKIKEAEKAVDTTREKMLEPSRRKTELEYKLQAGISEAKEELDRIELNMWRLDIDVEIARARADRLRQELQQKIDKHIENDARREKVEAENALKETAAGGVAIPAPGKFRIFQNVSDSKDCQSTATTATIIEPDRPCAKVVISHGDMLIESQRIVLNDKCPNERVCCAEGKTDTASDDAESYTFSVSGPIRLEDNDSSETMAKALRSIPYVSRLFKNTEPVGVAFFDGRVGRPNKDSPLPRTIKTWDDLVDRTGHAHASDQEVCDADGESNCPAAETVENLLGRGSNVPLECQLPNVRHRLAARGHKLYISRSKQHAGVPVTVKNGVRIFKRVDGPDVLQVSTEPSVSTNDSLKQNDDSLRVDYFRMRNVQRETMQQAHHLAAAADELQQVGDQELADSLRKKAEHHKAQAEQLQFATQAKLRAWREHQAAASQPVSVRDDHSPSELPAVINDLRREIRELRAEMLELREELKEAQNGGESVSRKERSRSEMVVEQYMGGVPILDGVPYITRHFKGPGTYYRAEPKLPVRMSGVEYSGDFLDPKTKERRRAVKELRSRFDDIVEIAENLKRAKAISNKASSSRRINSSK